MIARTVGGLCLVTAPGLVLLAVADAPTAALLLVGAVPLGALLTVVAVTWTVTGRPA